MNKCNKCGVVLPLNAVYQNGKPFELCPKCWIKEVKIVLPCKTGMVVPLQDWVKILKLQIENKI